MKKLGVLFLLIFLTVQINPLFAVSNAQLNGQKEFTITQIPTDVVLTCDLSNAGNRIAVETMIDLGDVDLPAFADLTMDFSYITDGIGWIRDPEQPEYDLAGDETDTDGKIKTTISFDELIDFNAVGISFKIRLTDQDGSVDSVRLNVNIDPQPPMIQGKVTDSQTGAPVPNIIISAEGDDEENGAGAITDSDGNFVMPVTAGTWQVYTMPLMQPNYQPSDTISVTVGDTETKTVDITLDPYTTFITGKLTREVNQPVPNIIVMITGVDGFTPFANYGASDDQGNYRIGCLPGKYAVGISYFMNVSFDNGSAWPEDHYVEPVADTLTVSEGQTATSDFTFKHTTSFITGTCTNNGVGVKDVEIMAMVGDVLHPQDLSLFQTTSDADGNYRLGVKPGLVIMLNAMKAGYEVVDPSYGYLNINIIQGQTVSGKDFSLTPTNEVNLISGNVTFENGAAADNVYVAAVNEFSESPDGFLITYTDNSGNYAFTDMEEGFWQVGIYQNGYGSNPAMRYPEVGYGSYQNTGQDFVLGSSTGVNSKDGFNLPKQLVLKQNFPNPFNPTTTIQFYLRQDAHVKIDIINMFGQEIRTLVNTNYVAGTHQISWDGRTNSGKKAATGVYIYRVKANDMVKTKKMILAK